MLLSPVGSIPDDAFITLITTRWTKAIRQTALSVMCLLVALFSPGTRTVV
jgi:hypothetical protein